MKKRIITSIVALAGIFPFFWFSEALELNNPLTYVFPLLFAAISFVSVWEMLHCLELNKVYFISVPLYFVALGFPMLANVFTSCFLCGACAAFVLLRLHRFPFWKSEACKRRAAVHVLSLYHCRQFRCHYSA